MASRNFSLLDKKFIDIDSKFSRFISIQRDLYVPVRFGNALLGDIKNTLKLSEKTGAKDEYERLMLLNLREKLFSIKSHVENQLSGRINYSTELGELGIKKKHISCIKSFAETIDVQKTIDAHLKEVRDMFWRSVSTEGDIIKTKEIINSLLRLSLDSSHLGGRFRTPEEYLKAVEISTSAGRTYHHYGRVFLSTQTFEMVGFYKDNRYFEFPDILTAARTIGEEGLLGHQGHHITTVNAEVPGFMKKPTKDCKAVNECIGHLGSRLLTDMVINSENVRKEYSDILPLLEKENKFIEKKTFIRGFLSIYGDYLKEVEGKNYKVIGKYLYKKTGYKYYNSIMFKRKFEGYYLYQFLSNFSDNIERWIYLYAQCLAGKIEKKISRLPPDERKIFMEKLMSGYWSLSTFEEYVSYLLKNS